MWETVLSGFEQRWGPWAGTGVETRFKIKDLSWWSREGLLGKGEDLWYRMAHWTSLLYNRRRRERRSRGRVTLRSAFSACGVLIGSKSERQSGKHTVSRWEPGFISTVSAVLEDHVKEVSSLVREDRRGEWNVTSSYALLGYLLNVTRASKMSRNVHGLILSYRPKKWNMSILVVIQICSLLHFAHCFLIANISVVNCTFYVCLQYCIIFNTYQNVQYRVQNTHTV